MTDPTTTDPTGDGPGRKIGNGVVVAHATTTLATGGLVVLADLDAMTGLITFLVLFAAVFAGDLAIQHRDMSGAEPASAERERAAVAVSTGDD